MILVKKHVQGGKLILAICDADLLGKKLEDGNKQLDLSGAFYKGEEMKEEEIIKLCKEALSVNVVGKESTRLLEKAGILKGVQEMDSIPYGMVFAV